MCTAGRVEDTAFWLGSHQVAAAQAMTTTTTAAEASGQEAWARWAASRPPPPPPHEYALQEASAYHVVHTDLPRERSWGDYISEQDCHVRALLCGVGIRDADLESLTGYLDLYLQRFVAHRGQAYDLTLDLSCNFGISDYGITVHIAAFLKKWPVCRQLRLYQTSIGDRSLKALSPWIAKGYAQEIHLSDLGGEVTGEVVLQILRAIHRKGNYPYWKGNGGQAALWMRLEHNRIYDVDSVVAQARVEGISVRVLGRAEVASVRPGDDLRRRGQGNPEVNLVLFRLQHQKEVIQDECVDQSREILALLHGSGHAAGPGARPPRGRHGATLRQDPQPLSVDEFRLWEMQAREDQEIGADVRNAETFGDDSATGWSFEENLAANEWLADQAWRKAQAQQEERILQGYACYRDYPAVPASTEPEHPAAQPQGRRRGRGAAKAAAAGAADAKLKPHGGGANAGGGGNAAAGGGGGRGGPPPDADTESTAGSSGGKQYVAKGEVDGAICSLLQNVGVLQGADFDGQVRQYLHAIRTKRGPQGVRDAVQAIREATFGKTRNSIGKWPAYLVALLKRLLKGPREQAVPAPPSLPPNIAAVAWEERGETYLGGPIAL